MPVSGWPGATALGGGSLLHMLFVHTLDVAWRSCLQRPALVLGLVCGFRAALVLSLLGLLNCDVAVPALPRSSCPFIFDLIFGF